jgi:protein-S-isoprenylcysteine O-methyltransferase Ste14
MPKLEKLPLGRLGSSHPKNVQSDFTILSACHLSQIDHTMHSFLPLSTVVMYVGWLELLLFALVLFGLMLPFCCVPTKVAVQSKCSQAFSAVLFLVMITTVGINTFGSYSDLFDWSEFNPSPALQVVGEVMFLPSMYLMGSSQYWLGKQWTATIQIVEGHELIVTGPYRFIRHPFLLSTVLTSVSILCFTGCWLSFAAYILNLIYCICLIPQEEKSLKNEFGEQYADYQENTGCFIPKVITAFISSMVSKCKDSTSRNVEESLLTEPVNPLEHYGTLPI